MSLTHVAARTRQRRVDSRPLAAGPRPRRQFKRSPTPKTVKVKTLTGETLTFQMSSRDFAFDVAVKVQEVKGAPLNQMRLIHVGRQLDGAETIEALAGEDRELDIYLLYKLGGGKPVIYLYPSREQDIKVDLTLCSDCW